MKTFVFERAQHEPELGESSVCEGEAGRGVYAYIPQRSMRAYYTAGGEALFRLTHRTGEIVELKGSLLTQLVQAAWAEFSALAKQIPGYKAPRVCARSVQRYGRVVEKFINTHYPEAVAYVVPHTGHGIPTGRQAVIRNLAAFHCERL